MGTFDDRVVIVTGGALGMGGDTAFEFAREGASVVVADVNRRGVGPHRRSQCEEPLSDGKVREFRARRSGDSGVRPQSVQ